MRNIICLGNALVSINTHEETLTPRVWLPEALVLCRLRKGLVDAGREDASGRACAAFCFQYPPSAKPGPARRGSHIHNDIPNINAPVDTHTHI